MGFSLKLPAIKLPNTVASIVSTVKPSLPTVLANANMMTVAKTVAMLTPVGAVAVIADEAITHPDATKQVLAVVKDDAVKVGSTLSTASIAVVSDAKSGATTLVKDTGSAVSAVGSGLENMMYMGMAGGGLVIIIMLLK